MSEHPKQWNAPTEDLISLYVEFVQSHGTENPISSIWLDLIEELERRGVTNEQLVVERAKRKLGVTRGYFRL